MDNLSQNEAMPDKDYRELVTAQEGELRDRYEQYRSSIENTLPIDRFERHAVGQDDRGITVYEERHAGTYKEPSYPMSFDTFIKNYDNEFTREYNQNKANQEAGENLKNKKESGTLVYEDLTPEEKLERESKDIPPTKQPKNYEDLTITEKSQMTVRQKQNMLLEQYPDYGPPQKLVDDAKMSPSITEVELLKKTVGNLRDKFFGKSESQENKLK